MGKPLVFYEAMDLVIPELKDSEKSVLNDSIVTHSPIIVRIEATHAGIVTKNLTRYVPEKMERSAHTWVSDYQRPILKHHDSHSDAIGRVINAEYVRTSFMSDEEDISVPAGHIQLYARITDSDAIQKIMDGRFQTVSIGCSTTDVKCSICGKNISDSGLCEHVRGKQYGDEVKKLCYWDIGDVSYKECSFVNAPADKFAKVTGIEVDTAAQELNTSKGKEYKESAQVNIWTADSKEDKHMFTFADEKVDQSGANANKKTGSTGHKTECDGEWTAEDLKMLTTLEAEMEKELGDAKLSTEKRKDLAASAFCGPNRSFPVPDYAHVTAARNIINSYSGPGDKSKILASVDRKAEAMSNNSSKKDEMDKLPDKVFCLVKDSEGGNKIRAYPADCAENLVKSIMDLADDGNISTEEKKMIHTSLVDRSKAFGISIEDWDPQNEKQIKWSHITLSEATVEQILALPIMKDYIPKSEIPDPTENADEALKAGFNALKDKLEDANTKIEDLKVELEQRKSEALKAAEENSELHKKIQRNLAEKVARLRYQLSKPDMADVKKPEDMEAKICEFAQREKTSLIDALKDLEAEAPIFKPETGPGEKVSPKDAAEKDSKSDLEYEGSGDHVEENEEKDPTVEELLGIN